MFEILSNGLFISQQDGESKFLCGPIRVLGITRDSDNRRNYGLLIEWINLDNKTIRQIFPRKQIINENGRQLKEVLVDTGLAVSNRARTWEHIITFLTQSTPKARLISSSQTGWLNHSFITPDWCISKEHEPVIYSGSRTELMSSKGSLESWQTSVAPLCLNNPMLIFSICSGLAAPLLYWLNWPSCGVHLFGKSKIAKTTVLNLAASLYSNQDYVYSWRSTANGLEIIASTHNDMLLCLDELHQVNAEDVDQSIYMLANGMSKIRSNQDGSLGEKRKWRLLYLSTGEVGLEEKLSTIQKNVKAGQEIRFLEVPATRKFGIYDDLHGCGSIHEFSQAIWNGINLNHGSVFKAWIEYLSMTENLPSILSNEITEMLNHWRQAGDGNQVTEAAKRFALHAVAGELAISAGLLPWPTGTAENAAKIAFESWLDTRGSNVDSEDEKLKKNLPLALKLWRRKLLPEGKPLQDNYGYIIKERNTQAWYLTRDAYKAGLNLEFKDHFSQSVQYMVNQGWMETSEGRGTFKRVISGGPAGGRYFKILPNKIVRDLALDEMLSQPIFPNYEHD